jgi:hypothetical protein
MTDSKFKEEEENKQKERQDELRRNKEKNIARRAKIRSNEKKASEALKHIHELPNDIIELIASKFPKKLKNELTRLSNESKRDTYFKIKSSSKKRSFFDNQTHEVKTMIEKKKIMIKKKEFQDWAKGKLSKPIKILDRGKIVVEKNILGLITNTILIRGYYGDVPFRRGHVMQSEYQRLTFENDDEIHKLISEYKDTFLKDGVSINEFKEFISDYLKEKYAPLAIQSNWKTTKEMNEIIDIMKDKLNKKNKIGLIDRKTLDQYHLHFEDDTKSTIPLFSIQKDYAWSLQNPCFEKFIWNQVKNKLNI